jgi:starvation-inducible DNA-binding protein
LAAEQPLVISQAAFLSAASLLSVAMAPDVAEATPVERPPRGLEDTPVQISRLVDARQIIIGDCRKLASRTAQIGDIGSNDLIVSQILRTNELQVCS